MKKIIQLICLLLFSAYLLKSQDQNDNALFQLAMNYEGAGDTENAYILYKKLNQKYPQNQVFYVTFRKNLEYTKKYEEAISVIRNWISTHPVDYEQLAYLGNNYFRMNKEKEADESWTGAINVSPKNLNVYRTVAAVMLESKFYEKSLSTFLKARKECSAENAFIVEVASLYAISENNEMAINEYLRLIESDPNQIGYLESLLINYIDDKSFLKLAINIVNTKATDKEKNISFFYLLAWLYGEQKNYDDAFSVYQRIEKMRNSNGFELFNFAERAFRDKAYEAAAKAYKTVIDDFKNPGILPNSKFGYAQSLEFLNIQKKMILNKPSDLISSEVPSTESIPLYSGVISLYEEIIKLYPKSYWSAEALFHIGNIKLERFYDLDGAKESFVSIEKESPNSVIHLQSILKIGDILVMQNKPVDALRKYESALILQVTNDNLKDMAKYKIAEVNYFIGNFDNSKKTLEEIVKNTATDFANDAIILLSIIQANKTKEDTVLKLFAKAEFLERQKKKSEALAAFMEIKSNYPNSALLDESCFKIAGLKAELNNFDESIKDFQEIVKMFPESMLIDKIFFYIAEIYQFELKNEANAIDYYDKILKDYPDSFYANKSRERIRNLRGEKNL